MKFISASFNFYISEINISEIFYPYYQDAFRGFVNVLKYLFCKSILVSSSKNKNVQDIQN